MGISDIISEIAVQVHSIDYVLKCNIIELTGNTIDISPREKRVDMFQDNDPVVLIYLEEGNLRLFSGSVILVDLPGNFVRILVAENEAEDDRRVFERYPVSMAISFRRKFSGKRHNMIAKNISEYGMCSVSPVELDIDESIDIDLITGKYMFYFVGKVIWRKSLGASFEYGLQLTNFDVATKSSMEAYLGKLKEEYRSQLAKAK